MKRGRGVTPPSQIGRGVKEKKKKRRRRRSILSTACLRGGRGTPAANIFEKG